jgi:hypothetical protein
MIDKTDAVVVIVALHEKVRALIHDKYPDQVVTEIRQVATSRYKLSRLAQEYVLYTRDCEFEITTMNRSNSSHGYLLQIVLMDDSSMRVSREDTFMDYPRSR